MDALKGSASQVALDATGPLTSSGGARIEPLLSEKETAHALGLATATLVAGRFNGRPILPFIRINRRVLYHPADIRKCVTANRHGALAAFAPVSASRATPGAETGQPDDVSRDGGPQ